MERDDRNMAFRLRTRLSEDTASYDRDESEKYVDYLTEKGRIVKVGNLLFDAQAMLQEFVCDTRLCIPGKNGKIRGGKRKSNSCCVVYTPRLSTKERDRIDRILPGMLERFPRLGAAIEKAGGYYEWDEGFDRLLSKGRKSFCVFLTPDTGEFGFHGCMIHAYCLESNLSPYLYKPSACVMFPLFLLDVDEEDEVVLVTVHGEEVMRLGEDEDNYADVGCIHRNKIARRPVYVEMKDTLVHMFGAEAWRRLDRALRDHPLAKK